jgi:hypothetical protein
MLGGSALITAGHWATPDIYLLAKEAYKLFRLRNPAPKKLSPQELKQKKEEVLILFINIKLKELFPT